MTTSSRRGATGTTTSTDVPSSRATTSSSPASNMPSSRYAITDEHGHRMPQAIAHRGFKTQHPENTMGAFVGAVKAGAHAIETDLHLTRDGVVVLSHDATLKRCFGKKEKIIDCDWEYLSELRTLRAPHEGMPRLIDLLEYLTLPVAEHIWLLLDIKLLNTDEIADEVMRCIRRTIDHAPPSKSTPWSERLVVGCWAAKYLPLCQKYFSEYSYTHIGISPTYARQFFKVPRMSFNILQVALVGPFGRLFMRDVKMRHRPLFVWTVNKPDAMLWSIRKEVDGVITDDPKTFLEICDGYYGDPGDPARSLDGSRRIKGRFSVRRMATVVWYNLLTTFGGLFVRYRVRARRSTGEVGARAA